MGARAESRGLRKVLGKPRQLLVCDQSGFSQNRQEVNGLYGPVSAIHLVLSYVQLPCLGGKF